jgi:hypothetical protein
MSGSEFRRYPCQSRLSAQEGVCDAQQFRSPPGNRASGNGKPSSTVPLLHTCWVLVHGNLQHEACQQLQVKTADCLRVRSARAVYCTEPGLWRGEHDSTTPSHSPPTHRVPMCLEEGHRLRPGPRIHDVALWISAGGREARNPQSTHSQCTAPANMLCRFCMEHGSTQPRHVHNEHACRPGCMLSKSHAGGLPTQAALLLCTQRCRVNDRFELFLPSSFNISAQLPQAAFQHQVTTPGLTPLTAASSMRSSKSEVMSEFG